MGYSGIGQNQASLPLRNTVPLSAIGSTLVFHLWARFWAQRSAAPRQNAEFFPRAVCHPRKTSFHPSILLRGTGVKAPGAPPGVPRCNNQGHGQIGYFREAQGHCRPSSTEKKKKKVNNTSILHRLGKIKHNKSHFYSVRDHASTIVTDRLR